MKQKRHVPEKLARPTDIEAVRNRHYGVLTGEVNQNHRKAQIKSTQASRMANLSSGYSLKDDGNVKHVAQMRTDGQSVSDTSDTGSMLHAYRVGSG